MASLVSKEQRDKLLNESLDENELYKCKIWATIMANFKKLFLYALKYGKLGGVFSNIYCYIGLTENHLNIVTLGAFYVDRSIDRYNILLSDIKRATIRRSLVPGRRLIKLKYGNTKLKISVMNNAIGTNIKDQKENANTLINNLKKIVKNNKKANLD